MNLKDFVDSKIKDISFIKNMNIHVDLIKKLIDLESIERYLNAFYGIELEITVKPIEPKAGRFYGKGIVESLPKM